MATSLVLVLTTMPDDDRAESLARTLVADRLAACVHVHRPMTSVYEWEGRIEAQAERQLVIKTTHARVSDLKERFKSLHPYELPEFVILTAEADTAYFDWVDKGTRKS